MNDSMTQRPPGWSSVSLGELGGWTGGGTPSKSRPDFWSQGDIPWVSPKDMKVAVIRRSQDQITPAAVEGSATKLLPEGSVLLVTRSAILHHTLPVAKTAVEVTINQDLKALIPNELAEVDFIIAALRRFSQSILNTCRKSGTTVCSIEFPELRKFEIPLPPLNEQRRIVSKIEDLTARSRTAREALEAIPPLLERFRQSVLAAAFRGDLTADWRRQNPDVEPASALLERIRQERRHRWEETELAKMRAKGKEPKNDKWKAKYPEPVGDYDKTKRLMPKSWALCCVADISECLDRMRVPVNREERSKRCGPYPYYGANGQVGTIDDYIFDEELVLVTEDETFYGRTKPIAYRVSGPCWVNNHAHVLRAIRPILPDFLCHSLMHYNVVPWLSGTTGRAKLNQKSLNSLPLGLPPEPEMQEMTYRVNELLAIGDNLITQLGGYSSKLDFLESSILAKAFRGELVPQDPNDEPASALLERIRKTAQTKRKNAKA